MSQETATFKKELVKLDSAQSTMQNAYQAVHAFILDPKKFLTDREEFLQLLGDFQGKLVMLAELATEPMPGLPTPNPYVAANGAGEIEEEAENEKTFTLPKALVVVMSIGISGVVVQQKLLPPIALVGVVALGLGFTFYHQLSDLIETLMKKKVEEEDEKGKLLEDWITQSLDRIRQKYMGARLVVMFQNQGKDSLPEHMTHGVDPVLYDRSAYFKETLSVEFLSRIGKIMSKCDVNVWSRRVVLVKAIESAKQAEMMKT